MATLPPPLCEALAAARSVGVITGAGVSAESGIQTYRGQGGLYDDPVEGDRTVEALSGETLRKDPDRTWRTIASLAHQARAAEPNPGHVALAGMERQLERFILLTQNVDGLHRRAGSEKLIEIHGHVFDTICTSCERRGELAEPATVTAAPRCGVCQSVIRPDVVLFGETLPFDKLQEVRRQFYQDVPDLVIIAGTSALFPYIVEPVIFARRLGRLTIEINPESTVLSDAVDYAFRAPAGSLLPAIAAALPH